MQLAIDLRLAGAATREKDGGVVSAEVILVDRTEQQIGAH